MNEQERELDMALADAEQEIRKLKERLTEYEALIRDLTDAMRGQSTWVGLTDEEITEWRKRYKFSRALLSEVEAKLKEKNT